MNRTILHVDINSYFATLLQQENPKLRGRPIGIVKSTGRTCIIAASKEAKRLGVKTGCRVPEAKQLCPSILLLPAQFDRYLSATKQLHQLFHQLSPQVYIYSLDEAFLDITDCRQHLYRSPTLFGTQVQNQVQQVLGSWVTCNVGISHNFLLAKLASETGAKGSVSEITPHTIDAILAQVALRDICGIGFRLSHKLQELGVQHPYQIRFLPQAELERWVGPFWTQELLKIAYGQETHHFQLLQAKSNQQMKTVGRSITAWQLVRDQPTIKRTLLNLSEEVTAKVRAMKLAGREAGVFLSGHNQFWGKHITVKEAIRHTPTFFDLIYHQLYLSQAPRFPVIKFGVYLGLLEPLSGAPIPLWHEWQQQEQVSQAKDAINKRYGLFTIRPGTLLNQPLIRPEVTGFLGDKTYHGLG